MVEGVCVCVFLAVIIKNMNLSLVAVGEATFYVAKLNWFKFIFLSLHLCEKHGGKWGGRGEERAFLVY